MSLHPQSRQLIKLTTHPSNFGVDPEPLKWGAREPLARGPVVATVSRPGNRNAIGAHGGTYSVYRAVAMAAQKASSDFVPDYTNTLPPEAVGPFDAWFGTKKIVSLDPWGHVPQSIWADRIADRSLDIRPTIAVTKSHLDVPEIKTAVADGRMKAGGAGGLDDDGNLMTTKAAIEPVWYLPGVAERFGVDEGQLRRLLYEQTGGMFPELVTRTDLSVFLPPIGGCTAYIMGDPDSIPDPSKPLAVRVHDECNGSDVFGSDICTCRPYLVHGIEECVLAAQQGGAGLIVYNRKEGRALGEVTKFMVYNARKRQEGSIDR